MKCTDHLLTFCGVVCAGWAVALPASASLQLTHLGRHATGIFDGAAAEIAAHDPSTQRVFVTNSQLSRIDVLDIANPSTPTLLFSIDVSAFGNPNSVAVRSGVVAVAVENLNPQLDGSVRFYDANGTFLNSVTVGALPDMLTFTPDGTRVLTANEGEPSNDYSVDPLGSVSIIDISGGVGSATVQTLDFTAFNSVTLDPSVRIYGIGASVAEDLEPEYLTISDDSETAWVTLQENNAMAIVDLTIPEITEVVGLGFIDRSLAGNGIDASDQGGVVNITNWPIFGMYQPDAIDALEIGGTTYLFTANEGDVREWAALDELARVSALDLDDAVFPNEATLKINTNLGRLRVSNRTGNLDADPAFEQLYAFGGRSFSVWDANGALVFDSGDELEQMTRVALPTQFNSNNDANSSFKTRSDDKGPEPEGIAAAFIAGAPYIFVTLERIGGIAVYDVSDPAAPEFVEYVNHRDFAGSPPAGTALDLGPESVAVIAPDESPTGRYMLLVPNEVSGSTSLFEIELSGTAVPEGGVSAPSEDGLSIEPNPAREGTTIRLQAARAGAATVAIYNLQGALVRRIDLGMVSDGEHRVRWDGRTTQGVRANAGVYFCRVETADAIRVRKIAVR